MPFQNLYESDAQPSRLPLSDLATAYMQGKQGKLQTQRMELSNRAAELELQQAPKRLEMETQQQEALLQQYGLNNVKGWTDYALSAVSPAQNFRDLSHVLDIAQNNLGLPNEIAQSVLAGVPEEATKDPNAFNEWKKNFLYGTIQFKNNLDQLNEKQRFENEKSLSQMRIQGQERLQQGEFANQRTLESIRNANDMKKWNMMYGENGALRRNDNALSPIGKLMQDQQNYAPGSLEYMAIQRQIDNYRQFSYQGKSTQELTDSDMVAMRKMYNEEKLLDPKIVPFKQWAEDLLSAKNELAGTGGATRNITQNPFASFAPQDIASDLQRRLTEGSIPYEAVDRIIDDLYKTDQAKAITLNGIMDAWSSKNRKEQAPAPQPDPVATQQATASPTPTPQATMQPSSTKSKSDITAGEMNAKYSKYVNNDLVDASGVHWRWSPQKQNWYKVILPRK